MKLQVTCFQHKLGFLATQLHIMQEENKVTITQLKSKLCEKDLQLDQLKDELTKTQVKIKSQEEITRQEVICVINYREMYIIIIDLGTV